MRYLSLFSGIGGFELGIQSAFPGAKCVGYSEIDKYAIKIYESRFPGHHNFGNVLNINPYLLPDIDLLVGGFPCQDLSIAKTDRKGLGGERSGLFWQMLSILNIKNPKYFLFENVASMPKRDRNVITREVGVEPVMIDAALVSAQRRRRLFWCNWDVEQPTDMGIVLKDIIEDNPNVKPLSPNFKNWLNNAGKKRLSMGMLAIDPIKALTLTARGYASWSGSFITQRARGFNCGGNVSKDGKSPTMTSSSWEHNNHLIKGGEIRKLSPIECERLQCFPDGWTDGVSHAQRYRLLGNAVNVNVVKHIIKELKEKER